GSRGAVHARCDGAGDHGAARAGIGRERHGGAAARDAAETRRDDDAESGADAAAAAAGAAAETTAAAAAEVDAIEYEASGFSRTSPLAEVAELADAPA